MAAFCMADTNHAQYQYRRICHWIPLLNFSSAVAGGGGADARESRASRTAIE